MKREEESLSVLEKEMRSSIFRGQECERCKLVFDSAYSGQRTSCSVRNGKKLGLYLLGNWRREKFQSRRVT